MTLILLMALLWPALSLTLALVLGPAIGLADRCAEADVVQAAERLIADVEHELAWAAGGSGTASH